MKTNRFLRYLLPVLSLLLFLSTQASCSPDGPGIAEPQETPDSVPGFRLGQQLFSPMFTYQVALADLDADGDMDAVLSNMQTPSKVLLNDGNGSFQQTSQAFEDGLHGIAIGDLDGDGTPDLIFGKNGNGYLGSPVFFNAGEGLFDSPPPRLDDSAMRAVGIEIHDIENDGDPDAIVHYISPTRGHALYLNDGTGVFSRTETTYPTYSSFGDLNGDGFVDMIARDLGTGFTVHLNDRDGNLVQSGAVPFPEIGYGRGLFEDVDRDGDLDFIYTPGELDDVPSGVLLNDGGGGMTMSGQALASVRLGNLCAGDLDNDGWADLIFTELERSPEIWMNDGHGQFVDSEIRLSGPNSIRSCQISDLDGDGDEDIFIAAYSSERSVVWFNELIPGGG